MTERVRNLPPTSEPFTRCGYTCRYTLPDARDVTPHDAHDAHDAHLGITVTAWTPGRREKFLATFPALAFRAMADDEFMRKIAEMAWHVNYGGPPGEPDPCGQAPALFPHESCVLPDGHYHDHESANGASWRDGVGVYYPRPMEHPHHPANQMRRPQANGL